MVVMVVLPLVPVMPIQGALVMVCQASSVSPWTGTPRRRN